MSVIGRFVAGGGTFSAHWTVTFAGQVIVGGILSLTTIVCVHVAEFPHASVARYVLVSVNLLTHPLLTVTSAARDSMGAGLQLSVIGKPVAGGGTLPAH